MTVAENGRFPVDLIIWDLDGTLADTVEDITDSLNRAMAPLGMTPRAPEEVRTFIGGGIGNLIAMAMGWEGRDDARVPPAIKAFRRDYRENLVTKTHLYPGVREMLEHFGAKRQVVISNKVQAMTRATVEGLGIAQHFAEVIGEGGDYPIKPDPASTLAMIKAHGTTPERTAFIGDSAPDFKTARRAGCVSVLVTYGMRPREEILALAADAHLDTITALADVLR